MSTPVRLDPLLCGMGKSSGKCVRCEVHASTLLVALSFLGSLMLFDRVQAQERVISGGPSCTTCRIDLRLVATLAATKTPPVTDGRPFSITRQSGTGKYVVLAGDLTLHVYDARGKAGRPIGHQGRGAGEFQVPMRVLAGTGDTLFVIDPVASSLMLISPNGTVAQSFPFLAARPFDAVALPSGDILLNALVRDRDHVGFPLHLVTRDGRIKRSFGADRPDYVYNAPPLWRRRISEASHPWVWTARELEYVLEQWEPATGERLKALRRTSQWFAAGQDSVRLPTPTVPPPSYIADILERPDGLLWIAAAVPDTQWSSGLGPPQREDNGREVYRPSDYRKLYDSVVEIIDPEAGVVLVSQRMDAYVWGFAGDGHLATYREAGQRVFIDIYAVNLIR